MPREIDIQRTIQAPAESVWELLEKTATWKTWWPECEHAMPVERRALDEGSQLEVVLRPDQRSYTFRPVIDLLTAGKTLRLTHRSLMLGLTVSFYLAQRKSGTRVRIQAVAEGAGITFLGLTGRGSLPLQVLDSALRGLRRTAETVG